MAEFFGHLQLHGARRDHGRTVLGAQSFRAPFHLSKPYWDADAQVLLVQVVNPTAGILAGDRLESEIAVDAGASLLVTTPSASRVFTMRGGVAECRQRFTVAAGGWLEVMAEPLVPHRGSCYTQSTTVDVARGGGLFFVDQVMPGRVAHGEVWQWSRLRLGLDVRLEGELVLRERLDQSGEELRSMAEWAGMGAGAGFANAVLITGEIEGDGWRAEIERQQGDGLWIGASALRAGGWSIKLIAADGARLRRAMRAVRAALARTWPRLACDPRKL